MKKGGTRGCMGERGEKPREEGEEEKNPDRV